YGRYAFQYDVVEPPGGSVWTALLTDVVIFSRYVQHILAPWNLSFYYAIEPVTSLADGRLWLSAAALLLLAWGLWRLTAPEQRSLTLFGLLWFFGALAPNANLVASAFPMQDRFFYLGSPGLLL